MILDSVVGSVSEYPATISREFIELDNDAALKRLQRVVTTSGREVGLRLPSSVKELHDGDVLYADDSCVIAVRILPTDVVIIAPRTMLDMGRVAHALGNRHLQAQFFDTPEWCTPPDTDDPVSAVMVVCYDHTVVHYLEHEAIPMWRVSRVMPHAFRHAEHSHP